MLHEASSIAFAAAVLERREPPYIRGGGGSWHLLPCRTPDKPASFTTAPPGNCLTGPGIATCQSVDRGTSIAVIGGQPKAATAIHSRAFPPRGNGETGLAESVLAEQELGGDDGQRGRGDPKRAPDRKPVR